MGPCAHVLALGIQHRPRGRTPARRRPAGIRRTRSNTRPAPSSLSAISNRWRRGPRSRITSKPRAASRRSAGSASTRSKPKGANRPRSNSATRTAPGQRRIRADAVIDASGSWSSPNAAGANGLDSDRRGRGARAHRLCHAGCAGTASAAAMPGKTVAVLGSGHSAVGTLIELVRLKEEAPAHAGALARARRQARESLRRRRQRQAGRARRARRGLAQLVGEGRIEVEAGFRVTHLAHAGRSPSHRRRHGVLRPPGRGGRVDRRDRIPAGPVVPAGACASRSIRRSNARRRSRR